MRRGPQRRHAHQEIAVAEHRDRQAARPPRAAPARRRPPCPGRCRCRRRRRRRGIERMGDSQFAGPGERARIRQVGGPPSASRSAAASSTARSTARRTLRAGRPAAARGRRPARRRGCKQPAAAPSRRCRARPSRLQVDRRQALVIHAPAVVDELVERGRDDLGRRRLAPQAALSAPARSTQSRLRITSASRISAQAASLGECCRRAAVQRWRGRKAGAGLHVGQHHARRAPRPVAIRRAQSSSSRESRPDQDQRPLGPLQQRGGFGAARRVGRGGGGRRGSGRRPAAAASRRVRLSCNAASRQT